MKKIVIRPKSPLMFLMLVVILAVIVFCIWAIIILGKDKIDWKFCVALLIALFFIVYCGCMLVSSISKKIIIEEKYIYVGKDGFGLRVIQYEEKVEYADISDIYLTISSSDSRGKSNFGLVTPMPYLVLESSGGDTHAINVFYYTKKQVIGMIDEIIQRAKFQGNTVECESGQKVFDELKENMRGRK